MRQPVIMLELCQLIPSVVRSRVTTGHQPGIIKLTPWPISKKVHFSKKYILKKNVTEGQFLLYIF